MRLEDFVKTDEYGERFVAGHRVPLQSLLWAHIEQGMDGRQLASRFSSLSLAEIYAVLAYYYTHRDEVDCYLRDTEASLTRQREEFDRTYTGPTADELRARMSAKPQNAQAAATRTRS